MKIYVVTSGEYSDYGIEEIFTNEEAAKEYIKKQKLNESDYFESELFESYKDYLKYKRKERRESKKMLVQIEPTTYKMIVITYKLYYEDGYALINYSFDNSGGNFTRIMHLDYIVQTNGWMSEEIHNRYYQLEIGRVIDAVPYGDIDTTNKYNKVAQDIMAKVKYMLEVDGMPFEDVKKLIEGDI